ncbi:MAG TPA: divalent metal cation transporter [Acidimicrobiales bacterium]|nr:divalent metal cation transporter [Acidimicrobiales bacterium]
MQSAERAGNGDTQVPGSATLVLERGKLLAVESTAPAAEVRSRVVGEAKVIAAKRPLAPRHWALVGFLAVLGPGLMVMLADTDAGSVVTAAQSGARWGYSLLPLEVGLIPVLYLVMELTVRLGIATGKGHARLVRDCFGGKWAFISVATLVLSTTGALVTELAGISGVAAMEGIPPLVSVPAAAVFLGLIVLSGSYRRVERIGVGLGLFELAFLVAALRAHPAVASLAKSFTSLGPVGHSGYLAIVAANVGAVVMPWMIFYQQAAVVDKGLTPKDLHVARADTAIGAVITQVVMIAVLVATAAAVYAHRGSHGTMQLRNVQSISAALVPSLGVSAGRLAFALGITGAALVAAIVVSLAAAWAFAEASGARGSLNQRARQAPVFYGAYYASLAIAAVLALAWGHAVQLSIAVEIGNSLLLPIVLGFLLAIAWKALPAPYRLSRARSAITVVVVVAVLVLNFVMVFQGGGL